MSNLKNAQAGFSYKIKSTPAGELAQKLASVGLYKGSTLTKLDTDDIKYSTIKVNTKNGVVALAGQLAKNITVKAGKGDPRPLHEAVMVCHQGNIHTAPFTNVNNSGRTGRGDTTFAAYLAWRQDHDAAESTRFAAALCSLKMEKPGVFRGTLEEVLKRMEQDRM